MEINPTNIVGGYPTNVVGARVWNGQLWPAAPSGASLAARLRSQSSLRSYPHCGVKLQATLSSRFKLASLAMFWLSVSTGYTLLRKIGELYEIFPFRSINTWKNHPLSYLQYNLYHFPHLLIFSYTRIESGQIYCSKNIEFEVCCTYKSCHCQSILDSDLRFYVISRHHFWWVLHD